MELKKTCVQCGKPFTARRRDQRYCSEACRRLAYRRHPRREEDEGDGPVLRTFTCARCGRTVRVTSPDDHRKKFCSSHCERLYWKHSKKPAPPKEVHRTFTCRQCGKEVTITSPRSRRRLFCSAECRLRWHQGKARQKKAARETL